MPPFVKVCVLGSTGVGKTKLIQQFVYNYYDDQYEATTAVNNKDNIYHCSTMFNGNLYQLKIIDMPAIKEFPTDATTEWSQYQQCQLRNANAYIFCFDLNSPATFNYVKCKSLINIPIQFNSKKKIIDNQARTFPFPNSLLDSNNFLTKITCTIEQAMMTAHCKMDQFCT